MKDGEINDKRFTNNGYRYVLLSPVLVISKVKLNGVDISKYLSNQSKFACKDSKYNADDHFALYRKMVDIDSKAQRKVIEYKLSRYDCYLIVMDGNPSLSLIESMSK